MKTVTASEAVRALSVLSAHQVNLVHIHQTMGCVPDVTRRTEKICSLGEYRRCSVFGITWWPDSGRFAGYEVCLAHDWVGGPDGPGASLLPVPFRLVRPSNHTRRVLALIPQANLIAWAAAEKKSCLGSGCKAMDTHRSNAADSAAAWLDQLFVTYTPEAVLITSPTNVFEKESDDDRLRSVGIQVKTTTLHGPVESYRDFIRMERIIGLAQGMAYARCPGNVWVAPELRLQGLPAIAPREEEDAEIRDALTIAAIHAVEELRARETSGEK